MVRTIQTISGSERPKYAFKWSKSIENGNQHPSDEQAAAIEVSSIEIIGCVVNDCTRRAHFATIKGGRPSHCGTHAYKCMFKVVPRSCGARNCDAPGIYIYKRNRGRKSLLRYCERHKRDGMVLHQTAKCASVSSCERMPRFGCPDKKQRQFCTLHKDEAVDDGAKEKDVTTVKRTRRCRPCLVCSEPLIFGYPGEKALKCSKHKKDGMIIVVHHNNTSSFTRGNESDEPIFLCSDHKRKSAAKGRSFCIEDGCTRRKLFGVDGSKPEYCGEHAKEGMVNVVSLRCVFEGCRTYPRYGSEDAGSIATYCNTHKLDGMRKVKDVYVPQPGKRRKRKRVTAPVGTATLLTILENECETDDDPEVEQQVGEYAYSPSDYSEDDALYSANIMNRNKRRLLIAL